MADAASVGAGSENLRSGAPAVTASGAAPRPVRRRFSLNWLGALPLLAYLGLFLIVPTVIVAVQAFRTTDGRLTLENLRTLTEGFIIRSFVNSMVVSLVSAVLGALLGALLAYVLVTGRPDGWLRQVVTSVSGVLAQFGGVTLAFAFISTVGGEGFLTLLLSDAGIKVGSTWLYQVTGLIVVYLYFQIPLMVLVFLPALDGIRPQWREATESLGGSTWQYWRHVALPLLTPSFLGATLLLFANAFAAFATAAALISQGGVIVPLQIRNYMTSEVGTSQENVGKALALGMIVVVSIAMTLYAVLQRRSAKWLR